jgi:hypothetical protein
MEKYVDIFMVLEAGQPTAQLSEGINKQLLRIHRLGKPSSTYAFIMRLGLAVKTNEVSEEEAKKILLVLEDFLFRRAICGIEPTGLHAVFKGLWSELSNHPNGPEFSANRVKAAIAAKSTIAWPNDEEFIENIKSGDLYHRKVSKFALREYEAACDGDSSTDNFHIEHVLPQTITPHWQSVFGSNHSTLCNTWANLVPLSAAMNPSVGQGSYGVKRAAFLNSMFSSARSLANNYETWTPDSLTQRAASLAKWAVTRWPNSKS